MKPLLSPQIHHVCKDDLEEMLRSIPADVAKRSVAAPTMIWLLGPEEQCGKHSFRDALKKRKEEHRDELESRLQDFTDENDEVT